MTQVDLAAKLGLHPVTIAKWETGQHQPSDLVLRQLSRELGVSVAYLRGEDDSAKPAKLGPVAHQAKIDDCFLTDGVIGSAFLMVEKLAAFTDEPTSVEKKKAMLIGILHLMEERHISDAAKLPKEDLFRIA